MNNYLRRILHALKKHGRVAYGGVHFFFLPLNMVSQTPKISECVRNGSGLYIREWSNGLCLPCGNVRSQAIPLYTLDSSRVHCMATGEGDSSPPTCFFSCGLKTGCGLESKLGKEVELGRGSEEGITSGVRPENRARQKTWWKAKVCKNFGG